MMARLGCLALSLLICFSPSRSWGCSIPVFRYALERWQASPYEVLVFHRGSLTEDQGTLLDALEASGANARIVPIDVAEAIPPDRLPLWQQYETEAVLPWVVVHFPDSDEAQPLAWVGALTKENLDSLVNSRTRAKVARHLMTGDAAVFVLVLSGESERDAAARKMVEETLAQLEKDTELPAVEADGPQLLSSLPLRAAFPVITMTRPSAEEQPFLKMLLRVEEDLPAVKDHPILFPIFGRGRVLTGLYGDDLTPDELKRVVTFLCGPCSCQVKRLNPGLDLLMAAKWETILDEEAPSEEREPEAKEQAPPLPPAPEVLATTEADVPLSMSPTPVVTPQMALHPWLMGGILLAGLLVLLTGAWLVLMYFGRSANP